MDEKEIEQEKLRLLNEALTALIGNIQLTDQAVEKLGKRLGVDKLKAQAEEAAKAAAAAAAASDANTAAVGANTSATRKQTEEEKNRAKDQTELFEREKKNRNIAIDENGKVISTIVELTKQQKEFLQQGDRLNAERRTQAAIENAASNAKIEKENAVSSKQVSNANIAAKLQIGSAKDIANLSAEFEKSGGAFGSVTNGLSELVGGSARLNVGFAAAQAVFGGLSAATMQLTKSIYAGERGAMVGAKAVTKFADGLNSAINFISAALWFIPGLGLAAKIGARALSVGLQAVGYGVKKAAEFNEVAAEQTDRLFKSFNELSKSGLSTARGMDGVFDTLQTLGMAASEIEKFNALLKSNSKDLKLFGTTTAEGARQFAEVAGKLYKSDLGAKLELLGVTADEQREHTLKYMSMQTRMGLDLNKTQAEQIRGAKEYIEQLDRLSQLTGATKKEQEEAREAVMKIDQLRAAMLMAEDRGDTQESERLKMVMALASREQELGNSRGVKGIVDVGVNKGGFTTQEGAIASQQYRKGFDLIREGNRNVEDILDAANKSSKDQARRVAPLAKISGDTSGLFLGGIGSTVDESKRFEQARKLQEKNPGMSISDALKKLQQEKENNPDQSTKNMVDAGRSQQAAAMTMDSVVKSFNYSAELNKFASTTFENAVKVFGDTVGAKGPVGGTPGKNTGGGSLLTGGASDGSWWKRLTSKEPPWKSSPGNSNKSNGSGSMPSTDVSANNNYGPNGNWANPRGDTHWWEYLFPSTYKNKAGSPGSASPGSSGHASGTLSDQSMEFTGDLIIKGDLKIEGKAPGGSGSGGSGPGGSGPGGSTGKATAPSGVSPLEKAKKADTEALNKQQAAMDANKKIQADPTATKAQKESAQKSEDDANKESMKAMASKREAFLKEQNDLREINKKQRSIGKEVYKTMEDARKAGAAPPIDESSTGKAKDASTLGASKKTTYGREQQSNLPVNASDVDKAMATIRKRESGNNYNAKAKGSSASGAYQFIDSTWAQQAKAAGIGTEYKHARDAPKEVQDAVAKHYVEDLLRQSKGDVSKIPNAWYTGNLQGKISKEALAVNKGLTPERYQAGWMRDYNKIDRENQMASAAADKATNVASAEPVSKDKAKATNVASAEPVSKDKAKATNVASAEPVSKDKAKNPVTVPTFSSENETPSYVAGAATGGFFDGPTSGFPIMLHPRETVLNGIQTDNINQKLAQVEKQPAEMSIPALNDSVTSAMPNTDMTDMMQQLSEMMEDKFGSMLAALEDGNNISSKILQYSQA